MVAARREVPGIGLATGVRRWSGSSVVAQGKPGVGAGGDTRRRILVVALGLFAERGYAGTSIRDIAEQLGMTKAALYYHFSSKEEILDAAVAPAREELRDLVRLAGQRPPPDPAALLAGLVDLLSRRGPLIRALMADPSAPRHQHRPELLDQMEVLTSALAAGGGPLGEVRARAALGAVQFASFRTLMRRTAPSAAKAGELSGEAMLEFRTHFLGDDERAAIVDAALRALRAP